MNRPLLTLTLFLTSLCGAYGQDSFIHQRLTQLSVRNEMSYNIVADFEQDSSGGTWIGTGNDDIRCDLFNTGAHTGDTAGRMYFGGIYDMDVFNPEGIVPNTIAKRPIWYKSTFAEILALLLVISSITALIVWYIRKVKKMKDLEIAQLTKNYEEKLQKSKIEMYVDFTYNMKPDDERFLLSAINCIEANIGNAAFTVENLAEGSCCSRGNLHLRLKNITGKSPVELIKTLRMKKACALLKDTEMPISDIAEQCGYQTPAYFITVFKNTFGETPGKYAARIHGK